MGTQSAELAVAGELARADALAFWSVVVAILFSISCVICAAKILPIVTVPPPPPPPTPPPFLSFEQLGDAWSWYTNVCALLSWS